MSTPIDELLDRMHALREELEAELQKKRDEIGFVIQDKRACFPVCGIPKARRADYLVFDRGDLAYLNAIERFNCFYCSYANGVIALAREVAARTEQYWCPIKHARRMLGAHERYPRFLEFGDAESFRQGLERLRQDYRP